MKPNKIKAVILAGTRDFGRCPIATSLSYAFWPVLNKTVIENLVTQLRGQGIEEIDVIFSEDENQLKPTLNRLSLDVKYQFDTLPLGSGGCLRRSAEKSDYKNLLLLSCKTLQLPNLTPYISQHTESNNAVSIIKFNNSNCFNDSLFLCRSDIVRHINRDGFYDLKEELIPDLIQSGQTVKMIHSNDRMISFSSRSDYVYAIGKFLKVCDVPHGYKRIDDDVIVAENHELKKSNKIMGPAFMDAGVSLGKRNIISGPVSIGPSTEVGDDTLIKRSAIWNKCIIGSGCEIRESLLDSGLKIKANSVIKAEGLVNSKRKANAMLDDLPLSKAKLSSNKILHQKTLHNLKKKKNFTLISGILSIAILYSFWPQFIYLWNIWTGSDDYSSGLLVPLVVIYVIWLRRKELVNISIKPAISGLFLLMIAQGTRAFGTYFMYGSIERYSLLLAVMAVTLGMLGWKFFIKLLPLFIFMLLIFPLPKSVHNAVLIPLQNIATKSSVFLLQVIGYQAYQEGNLIQMPETTVAVVEACNGLRMIMSFFVICGFVVLVLKKSMLEKLTLILSCLPIALLCNSIRLTFTSIALTYVQGPNWAKIFHDFGGYAMMPLALFLIMGEVWLIDKLIVSYEFKASEMIIAK